MRKYLNFLHKPFVILLTVPAAIVVLLGILPILTVWIDNRLADGVLSPFVFQFTPSSAQAILSTTATGAMAALSLAYSLALLVFTLAAGNIGPRLLKRFTSELTTQITAGILGGTFLYSLHALLYVQEDFLPKVTIAGAGVLATISVLQLIYFVRQVAHNITIDEEVASISLKLIGELSNNIEADDDSLNAFAELDVNVDIASVRSGYIDHFDIDTLSKIASDNKLVLKFIVAEGNYILKGQTIAQTNKEIDDKTTEEILDATEIASSRSTSNQIEFSSQLLVEIALRALSPGINDTYTAIAVVDSLSNVIAEIIGEKARYTFQKDESGDIRLAIHHRGAKELLGATFHPLRRASTNNILMAQALAKALVRLYEICPDEQREMIVKHSDLLLKEVENGNHQEDDINSVKEYLSTMK